MGGCQNVFPDPRKAGPLGPAALNGKSIDDRWECDVADDAEEYPSVKVYETADEGGSEAESVLMRLRLVFRGLIISSDSVEVSVICENGSVSCAVGYI